jgi:hypothetical protein
MFLGCTRFMLLQHKKTKAFSKTVVAITAFAVMIGFWCPVAKSDGLLEIVNKTSLKIKGINPLVQYVSKEQQRDVESNDPELVFFKPGYNINLLNEGKKAVNVKMELFFDTPNSKEPVSYIAYDVIEKGKTQTVCMMCNHTPIQCPHKNSEKNSRKDCEVCTLALWKDHAKRLVIDNY